MNKPIEDLLFPSDWIATEPMVEIGDICEGSMLTSDGRFDVAKLDHLPRKKFCQFLGIGELTLVGWIQTGKIPRAAAIAFVLYQNLQEQSRKARAVALASLEPRVISLNGKFAVCEFKERDDKELEGHIIAGEIPDYGTAYAIAKGRSKRFLNLLEKASSTLQSYYEQDPDVLDFVSDIQVGLDDHASLLTDYLSYAKAKQSDALERFFAELPSNTQEEVQPEAQPKGASK